MTTKTDLRRQAIRAAVKIHEHLLGPAARHAQQIALPHDAWQELCRTMERLRFVEDRGWQAASQSLIQDFDYMAGRLQREIELLRQELSPRSMSTLVASAGEVAADLIALEQEFEQVELNLKERWATVRTAPITLEDVYLGPFRIVLYWERIGRPHAYHLCADEPNCPEGQDDVIHPHVRDHQLCEGDGAALIKAALSSGRLYDFFVLVRQILGTYNPDSAHVSLANWNGSCSCEGCDTALSEDDYSICERCDHRFCNDCTWGCDTCSSCVCSECSDSCAQCGNRFCLACLTTPEGTTQLLCKQCLEAQQKDPADETKDELQSAQ